MRPYFGQSLVLHSMREIVEEHEDAYRSMRRVSVPSIRLQGYTETTDLCSAKFAASSQILFDDEVVSTDVHDTAREKLIVLKLC